MYYVLLLLRGFSFDAKILKIVHIQNSFIFIQMYSGLQRCLVSVHSGIALVTLACCGRGRGELGPGRWHLRSLMAHGLVQCTWPKRSCQVLNWQAIKWQQTWQQTSPKRRPLTYKKKNRRAESDKGAYSSTRRPLGLLGLGLGLGQGFRLRLVPEPTNYVKLTHFI